MSATKKFLYGACVLVITVVSVLLGMRVFKKSSCTV